MNKQNGLQVAFLHRLAPAILAALSGGVVFAGVRVDIAPADGRNDGKAREMANWGISPGTEASETFDGIRVTLRATNGARIGGVFDKSGYATDALLASDGVVLTGGANDAKLEIVLGGLKPGKHSITTYHNVLTRGATSAYQVSVDGAAVSVKPSTRIDNDFDIPTAHIVFDVAQGKNEAVASIAGDGIMVNGLAIDLSDPKKSAGVPVPQAGDEHAHFAALKWRAADGAKSFNVYLGTDKTAVDSANDKSPEFAGSVNTAEFAPKNLDHMLSYFWRVDTIAADGSITKGEIWRFRTAQLAFPGAEGYGRFARGGRGGKVIEVTNLDDGGPGSLRAAVMESGPRTIVFRVGGTIHLRSPLVVKNPYCTIAGQTAPGEGIATRGATFASGGTHDTIMRYMRIRIGDESRRTQDGSGLGSCDYSIVDHCSIAWSIDEGFSSRGAKNITLQRSIITEPLNMSIHGAYVGTGKGHGFAGSIGGNIGSFHHNLLANSAGRNFSLAGALTQANKFAGYMDLRNNVCYNWVHRVTDGGARKTNFVGNYYIPGPATQKDLHFFVKAQLEMKLPDETQQYYVTGNVMEGNPEYTGKTGPENGLTFQYATPEEAKAMVLTEAFCEPHITVQSAEDAYKSVIADVGPNIPTLDLIDARAVETTRDRSFKFKGSKTGLPGIPDSQKDTGEYPDLKGGEAPADADHDGMPDWFEKKIGTDVNTADNNADADKDGWTNLEEYLNWIVENGSITPKG